MRIDLNRLLQLRRQLDAILLVNIDHGLQARLSLEVRVPDLIYRESPRRIIPGLYGMTGPWRV